MTVLKKCDAWKSSSNHLVERGGGETGHAMDAGSYKQYRSLANLNKTNATCRFPAHLPEHCQS